MNSITPAQVKDFLKRHFQERLQAKGVDPESMDDNFSFLAAGIIDSFGVMDTLMTIEREFQMEIDIENLNPDDISVMGKLCKFVVESHNKGK